MEKSTSKQIIKDCSSIRWQVFSQYGMILKQVWLDLHQSQFEGNIMTEYEKKFSSKGQRIYRVEAQFQDKTKKKSQ